MGPGIAATLARAGAEVRVFDISEEALVRAEASYGLAVKVLDDLGTRVVDGGSVSFHTSIADALAESLLVIEAVPEKIEIKRSVLAQIEAEIAADVIIATNTSGIPISDMAATMEHPERFIGMHWSNPPHIIPMIEVIRGDATDPGVQEQLVAIVKSFGYEAVVEKEIAGFVENRVLYAILRECVALLQAGIVSQEALDTCVKWGIGYKLAVVGPMRLLDMAGLDIYQSVSSYLNKELDNSADVPAVILEHTAAGKLGFKSEGGLYSYGPGDVAKTRAAIVDGLVTVRKALATTTPV